MLLTVSHLARRYGKIEALRDVSFEVDRGEIVGFLGPNGAGKSTTMSIVAGALAPSGGSVHIDGIDRVADPIAARRLVGFLPQSPPLYPDMRIAGHLDHVARLRGIARGERRRRVVEAMELADLADLERRRCGKLSGGQRQRVGLAAALIDRAPLLILDEPTAGLDPAQVANFRSVLERLRERHAILLSTHVLGEVTASCERVVVIQAGRTIDQCPIADLQARASRVGRVRLRLDRGLQDADIDVLRRQPWATQVTRDEAWLVVELAPASRGELVAWASANGGLAELVEERRSLEAVFQDLITEPPTALSADGG